MIKIKCFNWRLYVSFLTHFPSQPSVFGALVLWYQSECYPSVVVASVVCWHKTLLWDSRNRKKRVLVKSEERDKQHMPETLEIIFSPKNFTWESKWWPLIYELLPHLVVGKQVDVFKKNCWCDGREIQTCRERLESFRSLVSQRRLRCYRTWPAASREVPYWILTLKISYNVMAIIFSLSLTVWFL